MDDKRENRGSDDSSSDEGGTGNGGKDDQDDNAALDDIHDLDMRISLDVQVWSKNYTIECHLLCSHDMRYSVHKTCTTVFT
jgi:hypothetical protein